MTVQVGEIFDLHRFYLSGKEASIMPEQSAHHQKNAEPDQQTLYSIIKGEMDMKSIDTTVLA
jgi:hypothetical protein